ncbi:hypothetical protein M3212_05555 [Alkalihalobacillus oceani]|uniref:hypothetical protein n=1 Tax=Halalkalibacter oceani TaxID=1653776 RepID=UPI002040EBE3|nr:hypothetical protein [Halalkalibacter oceani]MCM3760253.1 hypothetical protein [Halalkalibacter oceani]
MKVELCHDCSTKKEKTSTYTSFNIKPVVKTVCFNCGKSAYDGSCSTCGYSNIRNEVYHCPNCNKRRTDVFCMCGYCFQQNKMIASELYEKKVEIPYYKRVKPFEYLQVHHKRLPYSDKHEISFGSGFEIPKSMYKRSNPYYMNALIRKVENNEAVVSASQMPFKLLIKIAEEKNKKEENEKIILERKINLQIEVYGERYARCFSCRRSLSTGTNLICEKCKWLKCTCGSCGCNYTGKKDYYDYQY